MKKRGKAKKSKQRGRKRQLKEGLGKGRKKIREEIVKNRNITGDGEKGRKREKESQGKK